MLLERQLFVVFIGRDMGPNMMADPIKQITRNLGTPDRFNTPQFGTISGKSSPRDSVWSASLFLIDVSYAKR
jgi:hypothetical protein